MPIRKAPLTSDYTAMSQDGKTITNEPTKNGGTGMGIVAQTYVDSATAQEYKKEGDEEEETCGWGPFTAGIFQRFRNPKWVLFWLCWAGGIQGMVVNGFVNVVISNIERRYDLSSTESGTIASCYDIASVLCLIPVSYFGGLGCKPRYLGIGVLVMGIGSFIFTLPQFTTGLYEIEDTSLQMTCHQSANNTVICDKNSAPASLSNYKYLFFLGQLLHGAGASPLYTLGVTYLDENLPLRSSSFYIGIFYALAIVGPAIGYLAGGAFLDLYVDIYTEHAGSVTLTSDNPRWVGAWWIGFLISGALAFIVALPLSGFPKKLPGQDKYKKEREQEVYSKKTKKLEGAESVSKETALNYKQILKSVKVLVLNPTFMFLNLAAACEGEGGILFFSLNVVSCLCKKTKKLEEAESVSKETALNYKQILKSVKILVLNPTFMFLNLAAACEGNLLSGFATFTPKFIEAQFALQASTAAQYVGYAAIPAGGGGTFLGGYLVKRFNLRVKGIISLCLGLTATVLFTSLVFLVHCANRPFAGVNTEYGSIAEKSSLMFKGKSLQSACNSACHCDQDIYNPVCGIDGIMYYSPCFAGCSTENNGEQKAYSNCSCVTFDRSTLSPEYEAIEGKCAGSCNYLPLFMPIFGLLMLLTFMASMPALSATLRCVPNEQRSLALGIQWIIARCLGSIPGPILFGKLIDITCKLWQTKCDEQGSCFFYDNHQMSNNMLAVSLIGKFFSSLFFLLALILYKVPKTDEDCETSDDINQNADKDDLTPPTSLGLSPQSNCKSSQSVHTAITMLSDSMPTTPATPNGQTNQESDWTRV